MRYLVYLDLLGENAHRRFILLGPVARALENVRQGRGFFDRYDVVDIFYAFLADGRIGCQRDIFRDHTRIQAGAEIEINSIGDKPARINIIE